MIAAKNDMYTNDIKLTQFLNSAGNILSEKDLILLSQILFEWHAAFTLKELLSNWKTYYKVNVRQVDSYIHFLCFNVRGLYLRWDEVCLLAKQHRFDIMVLGEVGHVDFSMLGAVLGNYYTFYQAGENAHGGVIVIIHNDIPVSRITCTLSNVCIIDIIGEHATRLIAIYAPVSKSWQRADLSKFITNCCIIMGDFNVDIEKDGEKADRLLEWVDSHSLGPFIPDTNTSLRSDRTIDYAVAVGLDPTIQAYEGKTCSDHKPIIGTITRDTTRNIEGSCIRWPVFSLVLSYTSEFWENELNAQSYSGAYEQFTSFLEL